MILQEEKVEIVEDEKDAKKLSKNEEVEEKENIVQDENIAQDEADVQPDQAAADLLWLRCPDRFPGIFPV